MLPTASLRSREMLVLVVPHSPDSHYVRVQCNSRMLQAYIMLGQGPEFIPAKLCNLTCPSRAPPMSTAFDSCCSVQDVGDILAFDPIITR